MCNWRVNLSFYRFTFSHFAEDIIKPGVYFLLNTAVFAVLAAIFIFIRNDLQVATLFSKVMSYCFHLYLYELASYVA